LITTVYRTLPHILHLQKLDFASDEINPSGHKQRGLQRDAPRQPCAIEVIVGCLSNVRDKAVSSPGRRLDVPGGGR